MEIFQKIYLETKRLFYRNRFAEYSNHLYGKMIKTKERFKAKLEKARQNSWKKFATEDLEKNLGGQFTR